MIVIIGLSVLPKKGLLAKQEESALGKQFEAETFRAEGPIIFILEMERNDRNKTEGNDLGREQEGYCPFHSVFIRYVIFLSGANLFCFAQFRFHNL